MVYNVPLADGRYSDFVEDGSVLRLYMMIMYGISWWLQDVRYGGDRCQRVKMMVLAGDPGNFWRR